MNISLVDDDINIIDQNPALLGSEMSNQIALNYMHYMGGSNFAGIRYGHSAGEHGAWAASIQYFGYGSMKETGPDGSILGSFSPKDVAFGASYSHDITDRLRGGGTLKMLYSGYAEYSAFALATDLGINYYDPDHDLSLSVVVANLGGQVKRFTETLRPPARRPTPGLVAVIRIFSRPLQRDSMESDQMALAVYGHRRRKRFG